MRISVTSVVSPAVDQFLPRRRALHRLELLLLRRGKKRKLIQNNPIPIFGCLGLSPLNIEGGRSHQCRRVTWILLQSAFSELH